MRQTREPAPYSYSYSYSNTPPDETLGVAGWMKRPLPGSSSSVTDDKSSTSTNIFFNYPSALFATEAPNQQESQKIPKAQGSPPEHHRSERAEPTSKSSTHPKQKDSKIEAGSNRDHTHHAAAKQKGPSNHQQKNPSASSTPSSRTASPTSITSSIAENFFNFPSALFEESPTSEAKDDEPASLFPQRQQPTSQSSSNDAMAEEDHSISAARKSLLELEVEIDALRQTVESSSSPPLHPNNLPETITEFCLRLDAIEISRSNTPLRTKRKELIQKAESLDPTTSTTSQISSPPSPLEENLDSTTNPTTNPNHSQPSSEDRFEILEREIQCLENQLLIFSDTESITDSPNEDIKKVSTEIDKAENPPMRRKVVEELVTQLCCKLDGVDLVPSDLETVASLKARRKQLLKRAQAIEEKAFMAEI